MRKLSILLAGCGALLAAPLSAAAAEPTGCDSFLWPLATEMAWMKAADSTEVASGSTLATPPPDKAVTLKLLQASKAAYATKPTSTPKPEDADTFGGVVNFEGLPEAGQYQVAISGSGWLDVVQNGAPLEAIGHTGSHHCDTLRKSVRFEIGPGPVSIQVSGSPNDTIRIAVRPAAD